MLEALPTPVAETKLVCDLVRLVISGRVRVPIAQRDLKWDSNDVVTLFDSLYRGYPIGALLLHKRPASAKSFNFGPLLIHAPEQASALDVVDGQQRLVALTASLMRPLPIPTTPEDPYVVYFDPQQEQFCTPPDSGEVPDVWVPLPHLFDGSTLVEWTANWAYARDASLRRTLLIAGTRIREYRIPTYTIDVEDAGPERLGEIFHRVNASARNKALKWPVIRDSLYGNDEPNARPATLDELADALTPLGMGRLETLDLLRCLIAYEGREITTSHEQQLRQTPKVLTKTATQALPTIRRALGFLRRHAHIEHTRLLPSAAPLPVLTRFFRLHPEPNSRSLELLSRWLWRSFLDEHALLSCGGHSVCQIDDDEELSVQRLLACTQTYDAIPPTLPTQFDARTAQSRMALLAMISLGPRHLLTWRPLDVGALIEASGDDAFRVILSTRDSASLSAPANRIILPGTGPAAQELLEYIEANRPIEDTRHVLRSHGISTLASDALTPLGMGNFEVFLAERERTLNDALRSLVAQRTAWTRSDRPSINYILDSAT